MFGKEIAQEQALYTIALLVACIDIVIGGINSSLNVSERYQWESRTASQSLCQRCLSLSRPFSLRIIPWEHLHYYWLHTYRIVASNSKRNATSRGTNDFSIVSTFTTLNLSHSKGLKTNTMDTLSLLKKL